MKKDTTRSLVDTLRPYSDFFNRSLYFERIENPTQEELFRLWIDEAIALGYILTFIPEDEIDAFQVFDGLSYKYKEDKILFEGKKREEYKVVEKKDTLLRPTTYTPDGLIVWNPKVKDILFNDLFVKGDAYFKAQFLDNKWVTILDVKAPKGVNRAADLPFSFTRRMLWMTHKLYVNKVMIVPPGLNHPGYLFKDVWTPTRYLLTDKMTKLRTIHYRIRTVEEFMAESKL